MPIKNRIITREVVEALRDGDHDAFEAVFVAYFSRVKFFINELIRSRDDAEELSQDIFVKLWITRSSLDPDKSFGSYIYTMSKNAAYNHIKHKLVEKSYMSETFREEGTNAMEDMIFARDTQLLIDMAVEGMPEQRKTIYNLSRNKGVDNGEIASSLKISKKTVENQLSLALKEIRKILSAARLFLC